MRVDPSTISDLHRQLGDAGADAVISRALEEIANRLSLLERCHHQGQWDAFIKTAEGLHGVAGEVGLSLLAQVAGQTADCARSDDRIALTASLARLTRLGDRALTVFWDVSGATI